MGVLIHRHQQHFQGKCQTAFYLTVQPTQVYLDLNDFIGVVSPGTIPSLPSL
jgi:hypothetical protein